MKKRLLLLFLLFPYLLFSQNNSILPLADIDKKYTDNADAVVIDDNMTVTLENQQKLIVKCVKKTMVLNEKGKSQGAYYLFYDKDFKLKNLSIVYYDAEGKKIKKISKSKFKDESAISNSSLYEDDRIIYYEDCPLSYPYTMIAVCEYETSSTLMIPSWYPIIGYDISVLKSSFTINNPKNIPLHKFSNNFEDYAVKIDSTADKLSYELTNICAIEKEDYSVPLRSIVPKLQLSPAEFNHKGVKGEFHSWNDVSKWINQNLLKGQDKLPESAVKDIKDLVTGVDDIKEKIDLIYQYMQKRCRYISVQIGIGGWKPINAEKVHQLGYGDCKALTNYTKALLNVAGIPAYYSLVNAGRVPKDINKDFITYQGNHAFLCVPLQKDTLWLECTNQKSPCGYIANFTDDREVFTIFNDTGRFLHTKKYSNINPSETIIAACNIQTDKSAKIDVKINNEGAVYDISTYLPALEDDKVVEYYKNNWSNLVGLSVDSHEFTNDKKRAVFTEDVSITVPNFISKMGNIYTIKPSLFTNDFYINPSLVKERKFYLNKNINRKSVYTITLPQEYTFDVAPKNYNLSNEFGSFSISYDKAADRKLVCTKTFILNKGIYPKEEYQNFARMARRIRKIESKYIIINK